MINSKRVTKLKNAIKTLRTYYDNMRGVWAAYQRDMRIGRHMQWMGHLEAAYRMVLDQQQRVRDLFAVRHRA